MKTHSSFSVQVNVPFSTIKVYIVHILSSGGKHLSRWTAWGTQKCFNPRLHSVLFLLHVYHPSLDFRYETSDHYDFGTRGWVLASTFHFTKTVPATLHLTAQWSFDDVKVKKKYRFLTKACWFSNYRPKSFLVLCFCSVLFLLFVCLFACLFVCLFFIRFFRFVLFSV